MTTAGRRARFAEGRGSTGKRVNARLEAVDVWLSDPVDHPAGLLSPYCFYPNGHPLERTHRAATAP